MAGLCHSLAYFVESGSLLSGSTQNFVPRAIPHPACNTAGTQGSFILYNNPINGQPVTDLGNPVHKIIATGTVSFPLHNARWFSSFSLTVSSPIIILTNQLLVAHTMIMMLR